MFKKLHYHINNYKFSLISVIIILSTIGLVLIQKLQDSDENQFERQLYGLIAGFFVMFVVSLIDYHFIAKMYIVLYAGNLVLMFICKYVTYNMFPIIYGWKHFDAKRWVKIGGNGRAGSGFEFMPSELTKIILIVCLATVLVKLGDRLNRLWGLLFVLAFGGLPIFLVFDQPDFSTTIVLLATFAFMLFIAGLSYKIIIPCLTVGVPFVIFMFWYLQQPFQKILDPVWQQPRLLAILHPEQHADLMYQQNNAAAAIESGGMFGKMIMGDNSFRLTNYVPVVESDFIFCGVGEEFGFIGSVIVIGLYILIAFIGFRVAFNAKDKLGYLIASGITVAITLQSLVNMGVVVSLLPNTGIPLPFMSSGLSSLLTNMMTVGVLLNVGLQNKSTALEKEKYDMDLKELLHE